MKKGKLIIIAAPSGSGKTTIVKELLSFKDLNLGFSISSTTRTKRKNEIDGKDYHYCSKQNPKNSLNKVQHLLRQEQIFYHFV
mgnify:CR=1 FL=1